MKRMIFLTITTLVLLSCVCIESVLPFSGATHRILSYYAASNSVLNKENYLGNYLGFLNGLQEPLKWEGKSQTIRLWMQDGSDLEDEGITRSFNHFHNPLKEWANAGLDDYLLGFHLTGESSLMWAQDGSNQSTYPGGDWSWKNTRDLYYVALTTETDNARQKYFAMMFMGLGHQIHLIQDMGVPEHARNDAHPEQSLFQSNEFGELYFEPWAAENDIFITQYAQNPRPATVSLNTTINNYAPITQFTDTNQYDGSNPSTSTAIGLSEYTNANFFSDDTIFAAEKYSPGHQHYFPYPQKSSTNIEVYKDQLPETKIERDGIEDLGFWIAKTEDGEEIGHFLKPTYHTNDVHPIPGTEQIYYRTFYRDEICHADYASALVPRAAGYSAGLLDYFFRGKIEITSSLIVSNYITLRAKNISPAGEEMPNGEIKLVVKYSRYGEVYYVSADTNILSIPRNNIELVFTNPVPADAEIIFLLVVYKGQLGNEQEAVGVGFSLPFSAFVYPRQEEVAFIESSGSLAHQKIKGKFIYVGRDEGEVTPAEDLASLMEIIITMPGATSLKFWINGIEISDLGWKGSEDLQYTGAPQEWAVEFIGNLTPCKNFLRINLPGENFSYSGACFFSGNENLIGNVDSWEDCYDDIFIRKCGSAYGANWDNSAKCYTGCYFTCDLHHYVTCMSVLSGCIEQERYTYSQPYNYDLGMYLSHFQTSVSDGFKDWKRRRVVDVNGRLCRPEVIECSGWEKASMCYYGDICWDGAYMEWQVPVPCYRTGKGCETNYCKTSYRIDYQKQVGIFNFNGNLNGYDWLKYDLIPKGEELLGPCSVAEMCSGECKVPDYPCAGWAALGWEARHVRSEKIDGNPKNPMPDEAIKTKLPDDIKNWMVERGFDITPFEGKIVNVTGSRKK